MEVHRGSIKGRFVAEKNWIFFLVAAWGKLKSRENVKSGPEPPCDLAPQDIIPGNNNTIPTLY
jgi:hypothetical protein